MQNTIETLVLHSLVYNESYSRKVLPFLDSRYFGVKKEKIVFQEIQKYYNEYNSPPSLDIIAMGISNLHGLSDVEEQESLEFLSSLKTAITDELNEQWLVDQTEVFCQEKAIHNAILDSINIINGENTKLDKGAIPSVLSDALAVSFDSSVGHDYLTDTENRFDFYHHKEKKIPFDIESLNKITKGGLNVKSLTVLAGGTGTGKSLVMCHMAAANISMGFNVLYLTLEMSEERIAERIDANLLDVSISEIEQLPKPLFDRKVERMKQTVKGKLVIKEYPTTGASTNHFRALLEELRIKKNFEPDIIYVDYLNICSSSRLKMGNSVNTYVYVKAIAEELRGLAVEFNVPVVTGTQLNRGAFSDMDADMTGLSDSFGTGMTSDLMLGILTNESLQENGQYLFKILKNRYVDPAFMRRFLVGVDYPHMRLYELQNPLDGLYEEKDDKKTKDKTRTKDRFNSLIIEDEDF